MVFLHYLGIQIVLGNIYVPFARMVGSSLRMRNEVHSFNQMALNHASLHLNASRESVRRCDTAGGRNVEE